MKRFKFVAMICCFVFVALAITPRVKADEYDKKTIMTFSEPFEVPGVDAQILPAGTYVFKLLDSPVRSEYRPNLQRRRNTCLYNHPCNPQLPFEID